MMGYGGQQRSFQGGGASFGSAPGWGSGGGSHASGGGGGAGFGGHGSSSGYYGGGGGGPPMPPPPQQGGFGSSAGGFGGGGGYHHGGGSMGGGGGLDARAGGGSGYPHGGGSMGGGGGGYHHGGASMGAGGGGGGYNHGGSSMGSGGGGGGYHHGGSSMGSGGGAGGYHGSIGGGPACGGYPSGDRAGGGGFGHAGGFAGGGPACGGYPSGDRAGGGGGFGFAGGDRGPPPRGGSGPPPRGGDRMGDRRPRSRSFNRDRRDNRDTGRPRDDGARGRSRDRAYDRPPPALGGGRGLGGMGGGGGSDFGRFPGRGGAGDHGAGAGRFGRSDSLRGGSGRDAGRRDMGAPPGPPEGLTVSGCQHATVGGIVCGDYSQSGSNHGRPVYRKNRQVNGLDVMLYFWDDRDGVKFSGWWFGPKVGGEQIWAYHGERDKPFPPAQGWQVPYDGPVDHGFTVSLRYSGGPQPSFGGHMGGHGARRESEERRQRREADRRREEDERRRRDDERRRREEEERRRREGEGRRRQEEQRRRDEDRRRQEEEARRRREASLARRRAQEEAQRQMEDVERKRVQQQVQQKAALNIRRVIQKVRSATSDNFEAARLELEETLKRELDNTGPQRGRIWQECNEGLEQGRRRIEQESSHRYAMVLHAQQQEKEREEKHKKLAEQRQWAEDQKRKHQAEIHRKREEMQQKKEEEQQRREEMQQKRLLENRATLEIRKAIQKIRIAVAKEDDTMPDYEQLKANLESALREDLEKTGSMKAQLQEESSQELEKLQWRVEQQNKEKEKKEMSHQIVQELGQLIELAEASLRKFAESMAPLGEKSETTVMDVEETMEAIQALSVEAQAAATACQDFAKSKVWEVKDWDAKQGLQKLKLKSQQVSNQVDAAIVRVQQAKETALRCAMAWQKTREIQGVFFKYGTSDALSRKEIVTFAKREMKYTVKEETLDKIYRDIVPEGERGVKMEQFTLMKATIGIARELERDVKRKEERVEKERVIRDMKAELQQKAKAAAFPVDQASQCIDNVEKHVNPLAAKAKTMPSSSMVAVADQCDRMIEEARAIADHAREHIEHLGDEFGEKYKEDIKSFLKAETKQLELKLGRMDRRLVRAANLSAQFRGRVEERKKEELNRLRKVARCILRHNRDLRGLDAEELFAVVDVNGDGEIDEQEFLGFFETANKDVDMKEVDEEAAETAAGAEGEGAKAGSEEKAKGGEGEGESKDTPDQEAADPVGGAQASQKEATGEGQKEEGEAEAEKAEDAEDEVAAQVDLSVDSLSQLFAFLLRGGQHALSRDEFMELTRMYQQVVKATVIMDSRNISEAQTLRRLDVKEVVEVLQGPFKEENGAKRIYARVMKDDLKGWITTSGNMGTVYLKEGGSTWKVLRETILTGAFDIAERKEAGHAREAAPRKLKPGELLEVYEWPRKDEVSGLTRMKVKVRSDGSVGWVTTVGNQGTTFAMLA